MAQLLSGFLSFWPLTERRESQVFALSPLGSLLWARKRSSNMNGSNFSWFYGSFFRQHAQSTLARPLLPVFMLPVCVWVSICEWAPVAVCFCVGFLWYVANGSREWVIIDIPIPLAHRFLYPLFNFFKDPLTNRNTIAWPINLATISQDLSQKCISSTSERVNLVIFVIFCTANHPQLMRL